MIAMVYDTVAQMLRLDVQSQHENVGQVGANDSLARDRSIEGDELSTVPNRKREQIDIGNLARLANQAMARSCRG